MIDSVIRGDCMVVMAGMPDNSVDSIITDPPYGLGFMGKDWDTFKPDVVSQQMKRDTRTQKRRELYGGRESDAPSAAMAAGRYDFSRNHEFQAWFTVWAKECLRVAKPGAILMAFGGTRTYHRLTCAIEDAGWQIRDDISNFLGGNWKMEAFYESLDDEQRGAFAELFLPANHLQWIYGSGFPKSLDISKAIDKAAGAEREVVGDNPNTRPNCAGQMTRCMAGAITVQPITTPTTPLAKLWDGWGTALKPSWEPIIVAMKPLDGTFAENAEKWGVAGLWIDGGRIGHDEPVKTTKRTAKRTGTALALNAGKSESWQEGTMASADPKGRFPANTILDEEAAAMLDEQSGERPAGGKVTGRQESRTGDTGIYGHYAAKENSPFADSGGASRFFYCAKASRAERNAGCEELKPNPNNVKYGIERLNSPNKQTNSHPTVKPLALMEYLCNLTKTPTGGIVLDPFAGSGTTGLAAYRTNRQYILIEKEEEYAEIARARLKAEKAQYALFGEDL